MPFHYIGMLSSLTEKLSQKLNFFLEVHQWKFDLTIISKSVKRSNFCILEQHCGSGRSWDLQIDVIIVCVKKSPWVSTSAAVSQVDLSEEMFNFQIEMRLRPGRIINDEGHQIPSTARKTIRFWSAFSTCWWLFDVIGGQDLLRSTWVRSRGKWEVYWLYIGTNNCCCCGTLLILIASLHSLKAKKLKGLPLENLDRQRNQSSSSKMARWQCRRLVFWKSWPKWKNQSGNFLYWSTLEYLITVQHPLILDFIWLANKDNLMLLNWW